MPSAVPDELPRPPPAKPIEEPGRVRMIWLLTMGPLRMPSLTTIASSPIAFGNFRRKGSAD